MELTKEQIEYIDLYLKKNGIKYWDLRIEMIDHIVSKIEENPLSKDFKSELKKALINLNWLGNLKDINREGWQNTNKKFRRKYYNQIITLFKSLKTIAFLLLVIISLFIASEYLNFDVFKKGCLIVLFISILPFFYLMIKQSLGKYGRSVNLDYGVFYFSFAILMINLPIQLLKETSEFVQKIGLFVIMPVFLIALYAGYKVYKETLSRVNNMKNQLCL